MKTRILYVFVALMFVVAACSTQAFPPPDPTAAPTFTSVPTAVPVPTFLSSSLKVESTPFSETKDGPVYTITAQTPQLQGSDDPRVTAFNARASELVKNEVDRFRQDILTNQPVKPFAAGSSLDMKYELIGQRGDVWSIKFDVYYNYDGAAHPGSYSITMNYDLAQGRELALDDLFLHGVNHLGTIADYCKAELSKRDIGFTDPIFQTGADPLPDNYRKWNLSNDGLVITFDEYQVAPHAAGPQTVVIPYSKIIQMAGPGSALEVFGK
jgi:hypothetical protein